LFLVKLFKYVSLQKTVMPKRSLAECEFNDSCQHTIDLKLIDLKLI